LARDVPVFAAKGNKDIKKSLYDLTPLPPSLQLA
jgi:hypothetical protein